MHIPSSPVDVLTERTAEAREIMITINGKDETIRVEPWVSLIDLLREQLDLTGTKKGCDHGQCGACTVLCDGHRILSCMTLAVMKNGSNITTIEGIEGPEGLHPLQQAFIDHDAFQCGYCTPGQICSAIGMFAEGRAKTREDVKELMSGNLCRCGANVGIIDAIMEVKDRGLDGMMDRQMPGSRITVEPASDDEHDVVFGKNGGTHE